MPHGFHAVKVGTQARKSTGWWRVDLWRTAPKSQAKKATAVYDADGSFDDESGRYTVKQQGAYFCFAQARLDSVSRSGYSRLLIAVNDGIDQNNGLHAVDGNIGSTDYRGMSVAGTLWLKENDLISMYAHTSADNDYNLHSESFWGCHFMNSKIGFHAAIEKNVYYASGWRIIEVCVNNRVILREHIFWWSFCKFSASTLPNQPQPELGYIFVAQQRAVWRLSAQRIFPSPGSWVLCMCSATSDG